MNNLFMMHNVYQSSIAVKYDLNGSAYIVLMALCDHYNSKRNDSFPSQKFIASKTNLSCGSVKNGVKALLQAGLILKHSTRYGNNYKFTDKFLVEIGYKPSKSKQTKTNIKESSIIKDVQVNQVNYFLS